MLLVTRTSIRYVAREGGPVCNAFTSGALQALPVLPTASPAREGHHADSEPPWADLGRPSRSVPAARA